MSSSKNIILGMIFGGILSAAWEFGGSIDRTAARVFNRTQYRRGCRRGFFKRRSPMKKLSAQKDHPYFHYDFLHYVAFCDGEQLKYCVTADTEEGWAEVLALDEKGAFIVEGEELKLTIVRGKIEIRRTGKDGNP